MLVHQDRLKLLMKRAMAAGCIRHSLIHLEWDVSGRCQSSKLIELQSRPPERRKHKGQIDWTQAVGHETQNGSDRWTYSGGKADMIPLMLTMHVRCRTCPACLRQRAKLWSSRALNETKASQRTWFGTLTLSPEAQYRFQCQAVLKTERSAVHWGELSPDEQFRRKCAAIYVEIGKYLKRVREQSGARLRFLCVAEKVPEVRADGTPNESAGQPHFHMLVHEVSPDAPVAKRVLSQQWKLGHEKWRLVDQAEPRAATYLCKYLSKEASARVRASLRYGEAQTEPPSLRIGHRGLPQRPLSIENGTWTHRGSGSVVVCDDKLDPPNDDAGGDPPIEWGAGGPAS